MPISKIFANAIPAFVSSVCPFSVNSAREKPVSFAKKSSFSYSGSWFVGNTPSLATVGLLSILLSMRFPTLKIPRPLGRLGFLFSLLSISMFSLSLFFLS